MRTTSYFAESIQAALEKARLDLGPEAMLIHSRKTAPSLKHLGTYEVVFGSSNEARVDWKTVFASNEAAAGPDAVVRGLAQLRREVEAVKRSVSAPLRRNGEGVIERSPEWLDLYGQLVGADFSGEMAQELLEAAERRVHRESARSRVSNVAVEAPVKKKGRSKRTLEAAAVAVMTPVEAPSAEALGAAVLSEIEARIQIAPHLGDPRCERRIVLLAGPAGAGKTTSLVKLAIRYGLSQQIPVQILSTDTLRVGSAEQLGTYAGIAGIGFQAVHTMTALDQALEESRNKKLVLIDTPGFAAGDMDEAAELAVFLMRNPHIEVQLVLPATLRDTALLRAVERFRTLRPSKILFTHVDEAATPGCVLDHAMRLDLPLSFLCDGQQIPDDIEEVSKPRLLHGLVESLRAAQATAA